jgi:citrate synthase
MLDEIGTPDRADAWVRARLDRGEVIMGFGHAVYRTADPRDTLLREVARGLGDPRGEMVAAVERAVTAAFAERKSGARINANVERTRPS